MLNWAESELLCRLRRIQSGEVGVLEGCIDVAPFLSSVAPDIAHSEEARVLLGVASEMDDLPLGRSRDRWREAALATIDAEAAEYAAEVHDAVLAACRELSRRFSEQAKDAEDA